MVSVYEVDWVVYDLVLGPVGKFEPDDTSSVYDFMPGMAFQVKVGACDG